MRLFVLIGLGLAGVALALYLALYAEDTETVVEETPSEVTSSAPAQTQTPEPVEPGNKAPSFDVVRVNPDGNTVIAGRGEPGSTIAIMNGDTLLGSTKVDQRGEWVFLPSKPLEAGDSQLTLRATNPDGTTSSSEDVVVLKVPEGGGEALALSMSADGQGTARALQTPDSAALSLSIGAVSYGDDQKLRISGNGEENALIILYIDNDSIGQVTANDRGQWELVSEMILQPGTYEIRADHVDDAAKVLNRALVSFEREGSPIQVAEDQTLVIQEGNSLWRIARRVYGSGFDYAVIYKANEDQIDNPDLIYPGQVITLPGKP